MNEIEGSSLENPYRAPTAPIGYEESLAAPSRLRRYTNVVYMVYWLYQGVKGAIYPFAANVQGATLAQEYTYRIGVFIADLFGVALVVTPCVLGYLAAQNPSPKNLQRSRNTSFIAIILFLVACVVMTIFSPLALWQALLAFIAIAIPYLLNVEYAWHAKPH